MKVQQFLEHHGIRENPFAQEDAQSDPVFKQHLANGTHHPAWDKIYGNPEEPATAVVFGEKGSGKTALRLQIIEHLKEYNRRHSDRRVFVVEYDDFNPFLDTFRERMRFRNRRPERALERWRLWDHMDAILALGTTKLVDDILTDSGGTQSGPFEVSAEQVQQLSRLQKRDLLMLTAYYDHTLGLSASQRWTALRRKLRYQNWWAYWDLALGLVVTVVLFGLLVYYENLAVLKTWWPWVILVLGWAPAAWRRLKLFWQAWHVSRQVRVIDHHLNSLRRILARIPAGELIGQPAPTRERSDDRYELLNKLQIILRTLGFSGIVVIVDRVDEPHLVNGSPERMRELLWPMFDNKFLKHTGIGFKLLLPIELSLQLTREDKEFYERSRLDKQNLIRSLEWTGESMYDLANDRIRTCATPRNGQPSLRDLFDESITEPELIGILSRLRVPRHLFKFMHRLLVEHCNRYTEENPRWTVNRETLQSALALYLRDLEAYDRGMGTG